MLQIGSCQHCVGEKLKEIGAYAQLQFLFSATSGAPPGWPQLPFCLEGAKKVWLDLPLPGWEGPAGWSWGYMEEGFVELCSSG